MAAPKRCQMACLFSVLIISPHLLAGEVSSNSQDKLAYGSEQSVDGETELAGYLDGLTDESCTTCSNNQACPGHQCGKKKKAKPNPCASSHKPLFYLNDFSYLNDPGYSGSCLGDCLKGLSLGDCGRWGTVDFGGQQRVRYHHEIGMGQDRSVANGLRRFEDTETDFVLSRTRLYTNWKLNDRIRFYVEGIFAYTSDDNGSYQPRLIDRNFGDFLNGFVDVKVTDGATVRLGRQELLYGAQRLVSPLDWANTRRTFEGAKLMLNSGDWAMDLFYTKFVPVNPNHLDEANYKQNFYGSWATYRGMENATLEMFYLGYDNNLNAPGNVNDFSLHTLGARVNGSMGNWLYDMQGGPQFGRQSGRGLEHQAMFGTAGVGRKLSKCCWDPTIWLFYDYASGDNGSSDWNRFNQLFPLAHKYFGFIDAVQRSNIEAPNVLLTMNPAAKWNLLLWYWHFMANKRGDVVPGIGGGPASAYQNTSSRDLGDELDLIAKYGIGPRSNILFGWSHFWRGNKITAPHDADFFYSQWTLNF